MSTTETTIDAGKELANWARRVSGMYVKDLKALSQEAYEKPFGEKTRTIHDVTAEVSGFNGLVAQIISGSFQGMPDDEARARYKETVRTVDAGVESIAASAEALAAAIEDGGAKLAEMTQAPWGEAMSVFQLANLTVNHMLYHDGQVNYVQALHGDDKMHWFDE